MGEVFTGGVTPNVSEQRIPESMNIGASYSTVCEEELLAKLVPQYLLGTLETCRFWQRGVNDTYQVRCSDQRYSLRVYLHGMRSRTEVDFEIAALNHLKERGVLA